jgi:hypothetical protein
MKQDDNEQSFLSMTCFSPVSHATSGVGIAETLKSEGFEPELSKGQAPPDPIEYVSLSLCMHEPGSLHSLI